MSLEAIIDIKTAEAEAVQIKERAAVQAREILSAAETQGRAAVVEARGQAETERRTLMQQAEKNAAERIASLSDSGENRTAAIRVRARARLDAAASLIVGRIVNG